MNNFLESIYFNSSYLIQNMMINIKGYLIKIRRYSGGFKKLLAKYMMSDPNQIDNHSLREFLKSASKTKFWKKKFNEFNVNINSKNLIGEISKLPILTKEEVKMNYDSILNTDEEKNILWSKTSGSTGSGLIFPQTRVSEQKQWAIWWRYRIKIGIDYNTWMGWFGGRKIVSLKQTKAPFHRINFPMKQIMFSAYHLNKDSVSEYYNVLKKKKISWLHGYPSQLSLLAHLIKEKKLKKLKYLKIITTGSENLLQNQISILKDVFDVPIRQHYGLAEGTSNISEGVNSEFVCDQDFCYTEFVKKNNFYKIIGTNYNNPAFPLIRYDSGDLANIEINSNGNKKIKSIDGRIEDYIVLKNGVKLGRLDHIFKSLTEINEAQLFQPDIDTIIFKIVKGKNYDLKNIEDKLIKEIRKRIPININIRISYVEKIKKLESGKLKFVISKVKN